jgi:uncharacterized protein (DUF1684 family)
MPHRIALSIEKSESIASRARFAGSFLALALAAGIALSGSLPAFAQAPPPAAKTDTFEATVEAARKARNAELKEEDSWLTLVGLYWLEPGENRFGSGPENRVIFPAGKLPALAGTLIREGENVRIKVEPGVTITSEGKAVTEMALKSDNDEGTTHLEAGSVNFFVIRRGDRVGVRMKDRDSETRRSFQSLDFYPPNPAWRVTARFEPYQPPKQVPIPNVLGQVTDSPSPGAVVFEWQGKTYRLDALGSTANEPLSLIFGDATNGHETYGAGRFLETEAPKDGKVVVDFNLAYNPPCAFTAFATCPLPPAENKLALKIEAGEKKFGPH